MTLREKLADWISGGKLTHYKWHSARLEWYVKELDAAQERLDRTYADGYMKGLDDALKKCVALRHSDDLESDNQKAGAMHCALAISDMKNEPRAALQETKP